MNCAISCQPLPRSCAATRARSAGSLIAFNRSMTAKKVAFTSVSPESVLTTSTPNSLKSSGVVPRVLFILPIAPWMESAPMPMSPPTSVHREAFSTESPVASANLPDARARSWNCPMAFTAKPAMAAPPANANAPAFALTALRAELEPALNLPIAPVAAPMSVLKLAKAALALLMPLSENCVTIGRLIAIRVSPS